MDSLKHFLDQLAGEDHPFFKGPDPEKGSALPVEVNPVESKATSKGIRLNEVQKAVFFLKRLNKN